MSNRIGKLGIKKLDKNLKKVNKILSNLEYTTPAYEKLSNIKNGILSIMNERISSKNAKRSSLPKKIQRKIGILASL